MENGKIMFQAERQERILEYINTNKKVRTKELSRIFNTSMVTIRADLNDLDEKGMIIKAHGGEIDAESRPGEGTTIRFWLETEKIELEDAEDEQ